MRQVIIYEQTWIIGVKLELFLIEYCTIEVGHSKGFRIERLERELKSFINVSIFVKVVY